MKFKFIALGLISGMIASCSHDSKLENLPQMTFSGDIQPIIQTNCASAGCHSSRGGEEFALVTYNDVIGKVEPGNARVSELYKVITHRSFTVMPPAPATIADDDVTKIYLWIEQGAKNN